MNQQIFVLMLATLTMTGAAARQQNTPSDPAELMKQAQKLENDGQRKDAVAIYQQILVRDPKYVGAHLGIGRALDLEGQYGEARKHLQQAIDVASDREMNGALSTMALSYAFEGNVPEAAKYYQKVFDRQTTAGAFDQAAGTANAMGRVYLETGDMANAEKWYRTGYDAASKQDKRTAEQTDLSDMRWEHAQARIAARRKQFDLAKKHVDEVKAIVARGKLDEAQQAQYPYVAGYVAFYEGNRDQAIDELSKGNQDDPFILSLLAQSYEQKNDQPKARELYTKILASPDHSLQAAFARQVAAKRLAAR
jgi:tetratricopeptide (TPR) repeat protein